jgi:hypothetical protein
VFGAPDPCGDVFVGFDCSGQAGTPPDHRVAAYVEAMLPGLEPAPAPSVPAPRTPTAWPGRSVVCADGPLVTASGFEGRAVAVAPLLGQTLAEFVLSDAPPVEVVDLFGVLESARRLDPVARR